MGVESRDDSGMRKIDQINPGGESPAGPPGGTLVGRNKAIMISMRRIQIRGLV